MNFSAPLLQLLFCLNDFIRAKHFYSFLMNLGKPLGQKRF
ncbi:hypothetical protein A33Q_1825 [Indibacter alkaliphilus LW1]|uniref:Uncharacterized protein n=1 Tax=Indibacter alkaliphilus (strain CCUG 57479 / KCTC 22604 / LW1) TaxID=1189612 RepID=S2DDD0_INDAL|nr:hypothetical protein A33Q_1825 [Indibacter alkaliphilus LW1]